MLKMRIPIREQLGLLVLTASLIGLAVIAAATWVTNHNFVLEIRASRLSLTASLKAAQLASNLLLMQSSVRSASTRVLIQRALSLYNNGNATYRESANWTQPQQDLAAVFDGGQQTNLLLQAQIWPKSYTGSEENNAVIQATGSEIAGQFALPEYYENGTQVYFGDPGPGYPPALYPNMTFTTLQINDTYNQTVAHFDGQTLNQNGNLLIGPWQINSTFSLISLTIPVINNTSAVDILGWITVVMDARLIYQVVEANEGLGESGITMIVGPDNATNHFPPGVLYSDNNNNPPDDVLVDFLLPPNDTQHRHNAHAYGKPNTAFNYSQYPAIKQALTKDGSAVNHAGSLVSTHNEEGKNIAVGYAMPNTELCDWLVLVEQTHAEVWDPIYHLRNVLLACVFGTFGFMILLSFPIAHYSSRPIRRLRDATKRSVTPSGFTPDDSSIGSGPYDEEGTAAIAHKEGFFGVITRWRHGDRRSRAERKEAERRRGFRIPSKVKDRKHFIHDELTDLTTTFNEMTDELMMQYEKLEERVKQRTAELEEAMKDAEAANESKTLFIANISHELKTPLNGILGMCAVCMSEEDPVKLKRSLGIIYKSGDLLLNLLTDLLTFSKNQVGHQQLSLDEKEFRLRDISMQLLAIFDKQAKESEINLNVKYEGPADLYHEADGRNFEQGLAPFGLGRVKDMVLWGDQHRILQVVINLISNSLKFTPQGGTVNCTIRCVGEADQFTGSRKGSLQSKATNSGRNSRNRNRLDSASVVSSITARPRLMNTANHVNPMNEKSHFAHVIEAERGPSPPPGRLMSFEFEVQDTGPGIAENLRQRIFEPFVQGDLGLSKKYGGTGLGLSICSQLATLMRGVINLESEVGRGSTFTMQIPLKHVTNRADSTASSSINLVDPSRRSSIGTDPESPSRIDSRSIKSAHSGGGSAPVKFENDSKPRLVGLRSPFFASPSPLDSPGSQTAAMDRMTAQAEGSDEKVKVLVAEDNKTNQEVVLRMLKLEDIYDVTVAKDGQEALDMVKESMRNHQPYNLIFMDVQMPNLDGLQSTRLIREAGYAAPIVALTAYNEESNVKECYESGMNYFLSKPIRRPALKQVLKTYFPPIPEEAEPSPPLEKGKREGARAAKAETGRKEAVVSEKETNPPAS
ncbi:hypothetical protein K490DRAFT_33622 [Saccharata proteae CBS 121410]|uniref:histidine kinase n=1 Tax=Saccharata proteae CBS 121410 TaxID=1314787 RepID=A0A9P4LZH1_9PEZI|nr:hypothetical protein K490DRAFT_33622 [Saccharata proteae CBS 121410]